MPSQSDAFARIVEVLDSLAIDYAVGGSVASSAHGVPRATMDVDIVVALRNELIEVLAGLLAPDFYVDAQQMRDALALGRSFNVIHFASSTKVDFFPVRDLFARSEIHRRLHVVSAPLGGEPLKWAVATPEDTILSKLAWFKAGGETSERQWNDLRGVMRISGPKLDREYIAKWAPILNVEALWLRLQAEETTRQ